LPQGKFSFQHKRFIEAKELRYLNKKPKPTKKSISALRSYYHGGKYSKLIIEGKNIDLIKKRSELAKYLFTQNLIDIYGQGWPEGISTEDSRFNNRHNRKKEILQHYAYNLCFENTVYPKYITEKIWESIESYCLPIYYGGMNSSIYEIFPKNSFIDYSDFENPSELVIFLNQLSDKDFIERLNKCLNVYNGLTKKSQELWEEIRIERLDNIVQKCHQIVRK